MRHFIYMIFAAAALTVAFPAAGQEVWDDMSITGMRRQARLFDEHIVRMGETGFSIARGYAISPWTLAEDNPGVDLTQIRAGQVLLVRKRERGRTVPAQVAREWRQMIDRAAGEKATKDQATAAGRASATIVVPPTVGMETTTAEAVQNSGQTGVSGDPAGGVVYPGNYGRRGLRDFASGREGNPHIALMLPLDQSGSDFTDFYKGVLLGLESLKAQGRSATMTLYNSEHSAEKVRSIVHSAGFADTDLVIGPVYENEMEPVLEFGEAFGIPVVSPLATLRELDSEVLWQMAPDADSKYDKLQNLLQKDANIILISSGGMADDAEFEREITAQLSGRNYGRFTIGSGSGIAGLIDWERPNVLVVLGGGEQAVNMALATISSSYNYASATSSRRASISVIGTSRWERYKGTSIDQNLFFKLDTRFVTSYYIDRSNRKTRLFEARYLEVYGDFPSKSAFRGYDAVVLFVGALFENGNSMADRLERVGDTPLGTPYRFVQRGGTAKYINHQWTLVSLSNDYNISTQ